jgi:hypothetical protein
MNLAQVRVAENHQVQAAKIVSRRLWRLDATNREWLSNLAGDIGDGLALFLIRVDSVLMCLDETKKSKTGTPNRTS